MDGLGKGVGKGIGDAIKYRAKQYTDLEMKFVKGILDEVSGSRELAVELFNGS
jgi:hypothetical protein